MNEIQRLLGLYPPQQNSLQQLVTGTIQGRQPSLRERASGLLQDAIEKMGADRYRSRKIAETIFGGPSSNLPMQMGLTDPTPVGTLFARQEQPDSAPNMPPGLGGANVAATVFHGSPHKFNKFDSSKIGTGEGAQAYGHGMYLAENQTVAKQYTKAGPDGYWFIDDAGAVRNKDGAKITPQSASYEKYKKIAEDQSHLYKVDLPDHLIARMLDWDKPLSQQSGAMRSIEAAGYKADPNMTAGEFILSKQREGMAPYLSDDLRKAGIPGIRYLDGGSRGAGSGTSNFVVFPGEEAALRILERNGMAP